MNRFVFALLFTLLTGTAAAAQPRAQNFTLDGVEVSRGLGGSVTLSGSAKGASAGSFELQLQYNPATGAVTGGTWKLAFNEPQGTLRGVVKSGTVTLRKGARVASLENVELVVKNASGHFEGAAGASGKLQGTLNARRPRPFAGNFSLTF
jgi:hypothetical protein